MQCAQVYSVPVLFHNLTQNDSYVEVVDGLQHLERVTNDIFDRLNARVEQERKRIGALNKVASYTYAGVLN